MKWGARSAGLPPFQPLDTIMNHQNPNGFYYFENHTSAQTNNLLIAAPAISGRRICVTGIIFSSEDAGTITLVEDPAGTPANVSQTIYVGATGGISAAKFDQPIRLTANKALGFTSVTLTNHSVGVFYFLEP